MSDPIERATRLMVRSRLGWWGRLRWCRFLGGLTFHSHGRIGVALEPA